MTVSTATGLLAWFMRKAGFRGWASFWRTIHVLPGHEHDQRLLRHWEGRFHLPSFERCHLEQIERDGRVVLHFNQSCF